MRKDRIGVVLLAISLFLAALPVSANSVSVSATAETLCGDNMIQSGEECDGSDLGGQTCVGLGYSGGALACSSRCTLVASQCTDITGGGGGGGSSGGNTDTGNEITVPFLASRAVVVLSGRAYPKAAVFVKEGGNILGSFNAEADASFKVTMNVSPGVHVFAVNAVDQHGRRSLDHVFNLTAAQDALAAVSGVFIAPTLNLAKAEIKPGDRLLISGQTVPRAAVEIYVDSETQAATATSTVADVYGEYSLYLPAAGLPLGEHTVRSKAIAMDASESGLSEIFSFAVRAATEENLTQILGADTNNDGQVNIVDLSVLLYWWRQSSATALTAADLSRDGKVDLVDLSILLFNWNK